MARIAHAGILGAWVVILLLALLLPGDPTNTGVCEDPLQFNWTSNSSEPGGWGISLCSACDQAAGAVASAAYWVLVYPVQWSIESLMWVPPDAATGVGAEDAPTLTYGPCVQRASVHLVWALVYTLRDALGLFTAGVVVAKALLGAVSMASEGLAWAVRRDVSEAPGAPTVPFLEVGEVRPMHPADMPVPALPDLNGASSDERAVMKALVFLAGWGSAPAAVAVLGVSEVLMPSIVTGLALALLSNLLILRVASLAFIVVPRAPAPFAAALWIAINVLLVPAASMFGLDRAPDLTALLMSDGVVIAVVVVLVLIAIDEMPRARKEPLLAAGATVALIVVLNVLRRWFGQPGILATVFWPTQLVPRFFFAVGLLCLNALCLFPLALALAQGIPQVLPHAWMTRLRQAVGLPPGRRVEDPIGSLSRDKAEFIYMLMWACLAGFVVNVLGTAVVVSAPSDRPGVMAWMQQLHPEPLWWPLVAAQPPVGP